MLSSKLQGIRVSKRLRFRVVAASVACVLAAAACGTTVPESQRASATGGASAQGLNGAAGPGQAGSDQLAGGADGSTGVGASGGVTGGQPSGLEGEAAGGSLPPTGRGWDENNVYIGATTVKDKAQAAKSLGAIGDPGDLEAQANAVANYYNDRGGLFGRKVVLRFDDHAFAANQAQPEVEAQASCTKFTQDEPVIAVMSIDVNTANYRACLANAGIPLFVPSTPVYDDQALRDANGLLFQLYTPSWDRFAPVFVDRLVAQGYFSGWDTTRGAPGAAPVRVGIVLDDDPATVRVSAILTAALTQAGHAPVAVAKFHDWGTEAQSAVLQMSSNTVTHIIHLHFSLFVFATAAEAQVYRPRYGVSTVNVPGAGMQPNSPAAQNVGAVGVGTVPVLDTQSQSGEITPGGKLCRDIMAANGQTFAGKRLAEGYAMASCDSIRLIAESALAGGGFNAASILAGAAVVGPSFAPGATFASGLSSSNPVVPGAGMDLQYQTSCSCYMYPSSELRPF